MNGHTDVELNGWLLNVINGNPEKRIAPAGDFLKSLANAALRADFENYAIMRETLLAMKAKYPEYGAEVTA